MSFTPGPWNVEELFPGEYNINDAKGKSVAYLDSETMEASVRQEYEANANLIAAAPDMYEELTYFVAMEQDDDRAYMAEVYKDAKKALAKAKGETP